LATKHLVSVVVPTVQTPFWPSQAVEMQLVHVVTAPLQVAHGDVHITQAPETKVYPEAHAEQVLDATMAAHGMVVAPPATTEKPRFAVVHVAAEAPEAQV